MHRLQYMPCDDKNEHVAPDVTSDNSFCATPDICIEAIESHLVPD